MFNALEKVALATAGTTVAFLAADHLKVLPGFFQPSSTAGMLSEDANVQKAMLAAAPDNAQQRVNSFAAGIITGGIVTGIVLAIWKR